jgi:ElaB/YqjD/DUF883 family membrane-anchored ribosome-binding protein
MLQRVIAKLPRGGRFHFGESDMPAKAGSLTTEDVAGAANDTAAKISADAQRAIADAAKRIEAAVQQGLEQVRSQSRVYADAASDQLDEASRIASEQIRARPLAATGAALGIGVLIGMLLASRR